MVASFNVIPFLKALLGRSLLPSMLSANHPPSFMILHRFFQQLHRQYPSFAILHDP
jgi:hypothetical protein